MEQRKFLKESPEKTIDNIFPKGSELILIDKYGKEVKGILKEKIRTGMPIIIGESKTDSGAQKLIKKGDKFFIKTNTNIYEMIRDRSRDIDGLNLKNKLGSVELPWDAKKAKLESGIFKKDFKNKTLDIYINRDELKDILIEVDGVELFIGVQGRFTVLAEVGNGHLPFYISSAGTSGKKKGEWYPYFGYANPWLVKGEIGENGKMIYSDKISEVQDKLNNNFIIPREYMDNKGKIKTKKGDVVFDIKDTGIHFKNYLIDKENKEVSESEYLKRMTGYNPENVVNKKDDNSAKEWILDIVEGLGK